MDYTENIKWDLDEERIKDEVMQIYLRNGSYSEATIYRGWGGYARYISTDKPRIDGCVNNLARDIIAGDMSSAHRRLPLLPAGLRDAMEAYLLGVPFADLIA